MYFQNKSQHRNNIPTQQAKNTQPIQQNQPKIATNKSKAMVSKSKVLKNDVPVKKAIKRK